MRASHGLRVVETTIVLTQHPGGMRLAEAAAALGVPLSSAQRAIASLVDDGLVISRVEDGDRRHLLDQENPATDGFVEYALRRLEVGRALDLVCRSSRAVEFAGSDAEGHLVVLSPFAEPAAVARLRSTFGRISRDRTDAVPVVVFERADLRERLAEDPSLRARGLRLTVAKGSPVRAFRDPHDHGSLDAQPLGRLHPSLSPSGRSIARIAREHRLARIAVFGSAVRADFRPDSDVDVLVEPAPGVRLGAGDLVDLREDLEGLFGHDVDVVRESSLGEPVRSRVLREEVAIYGRA